METAQKKSTKSFGWYLVQLGCLLVAAFGFWMLLRNDSPPPPPVSEFLSATTEEEYTKMLANIPFFSSSPTFDFRNGSYPSERELLNFYASTPAVQEQISKVTDERGAVEIPSDDVEKFVACYFGDCSFSPQKLAESSDSSIRYDDEKKLIYLPVINGGVFWPSAVPHTVTIDGISNDGALVTVNATTHLFGGGEFDADYATVLTIRVTHDGYNYVSYSSQKKAS